MHPQGRIASPRAALPTCAHINGESVHHSPCGFHRFRRLRRQFDNILLARKKPDPAVAGPGAFCLSQLRGNDSSFDIRNSTLEIRLIVRHSILETRKSKFESLASDEQQRKTEHTKHCRLRNDVSAYLEIINIAVVAILRMELQADIDCCLAIGA